MISPFVVISAQRSGSTLLIDYLNQHPEILCAGEIFKKRNDKESILNPEYSFDLENKKNLLGFSFRKNMLIENHLKKSISECPLIFGFKLMISQIDILPSIPSLLNEMQFKKVILTRSDVAAQSLSLELAHETGDWIKNKANKDFKPELNLKNLEKTLLYFQRCEKELLEFGEVDDSIAIGYGDLVNEPNKVLQSIYSHIGVEPSFVPEMNIKKMSHQPYSSRIKNFDEVRDFLESKGIKMP